MHISFRTRPSYSLCGLSTLCEGCSVYLRTMDSLLHVKKYALNRKWEVLQFVFTHCFWTGHSSSEVLGISGCDSVCVHGCSHETRQSHPNIKRCVVPAIHISVCYDAGGNLGPNIVSRERNGKSSNDQQCERCRPVPHPLSCKYCFGAITRHGHVSLFDCEVLNVSQ